MSREPEQQDETPVAAARRFKAAGRPEAEKGAKRTRTLVAGAAIGIGSAALVAALLYANRSKKEP